MSPTGNEPPADNNPDDEHYLVRNSADMLSILNALTAHKVPVSVQFTDRPAPIQTRLLSVKPHFEELVFDATGMSNLVFVQGKAGLTAEATYDYMQLRFTCEHVEAATYQRASAFRARIPKAIARSQRRGSMRFPVPSANPPVVRQRLTKRGMEMRLRVMDISFGGVCLILEDQRTAIASGAVLSGCILELPDIGAIETGFEVVYVDEMEPHNGWRRLGCRFSGVSVLALERVRDYVAMLERAHLDAGNSK